MQTLQARHWACQSPSAHFCPVRLHFHHGHLLYMSEGILTLACLNHQDHCFSWLEYTAEQHSLFFAFDEQSTLHFVACHHALSV